MSVYKYTITLNLTRSWYNEASANGREIKKRPNERRRQRKIARRSFPCEWNIPFVIRTHSRSSFERSPDAVTSGRSGRVIFSIVTRSRGNCPRIASRNYACSDRRDFARKRIGDRARRWKLQRIKMKDARCFVCSGKSERARRSAWNHFSQLHAWL